MKRATIVSMSLCVLGALPLAAGAQQTSDPFGPDQGEREFSISGTGSSDQDLDSTSFGIVGDLGWYLRDRVVVGVRQSINYSDIEGEDVTEDFWNGATRGYVNYRFRDARMQPFVGGSLGGIYGDGVTDSAFAGLETGARFYVRDKTYLLGRIEYQWFFDRDSDADEAFKDGAWAYTVGMGYHF